MGAADAPGQSPSSLAPGTQMPRLCSMRTVAMRRRDAATIFMAEVILAMLPTDFMRCCTVCRASHTPTLVFVNSEQTSALRRSGHNERQGGAMGALNLSRLRKETFKVQSRGTTSSGRILA